MIGSGGDASSILEQLKNIKSVGVNPVNVAYGILYGVPTPLCRPREEWPLMWSEMEGRIDAFLNAIEHASSTIGLAKRSRIALARLVAEIMLPSEEVAKEQAKRLANAKRAPRAQLSRAKLGETLAYAIELTEPLLDIKTPPGTERLIARVSYAGKDIGQVELPVFNDRVSATTLADAIASQHSWNILGQYLQRTVLTEVTLTEDPDLGLVARRGNVRLAQELWDEKPLQALFDAAGWTVFLQELWGHADWPAWKFYDKSTLAFDDEDATAPPQLVLDGAAIPTIEISHPLPQLVARESDTEAVVNVTIGGASIGLITVKLDNGSATRSMIRMAITEQVGMELAIATVREAIVGHSIDAMSLRDRLRAAVQRNATMATAGMLPRRSARVACNSVSRHADLPVAVLEDVLSAGRAAGESVPAQLPGDSSVIHYAPSLIARPNVAPRVESPTTRKTAFRSAESLEHARSGFVALPPLPQKLKNLARRLLGRPTRSTTTNAQRIDRLPILMYHRVSPTGLDANTRYRVTPKLFEEQLRYLRDAGYATVTPTEWRTSVERRKPLAKKSVLLTFDDGFVDFADFAWPLLKKYGFSATVFLVTDLVGKTNAWDAAAGETLPLMNWATIKRLRSEGCVFGSHTATHQPLTSLTPTEIVRQAARSRATMCRELNENIDTIAYPFGDTDAVVAHLFGAVGYTFGVTCERAQSGLKDSLLSLPRIEIEGDDTLARFQAKLAA
jgi:peptidoglycan/xylan/chitin deacetylase (PgdA/CDA1 family)